MLPIVLPRVEHVLSACALSAGRADYFGRAVNRAARFLGAACGGQVLAERGLVEEVVQYWHSLVYKCNSSSLQMHSRKLFVYQVVLTQKDQNSQNARVGSFNLVDLTSKLHVY